MLRRWIIRGLAIALLTLCVTAWVGSWFFKFGPDCKHGAGRRVEMIAECGSIDIMDHKPNWATSDYWFTWAGASYSERANFYQCCKYHFIGFGFGTNGIDAPWDAYFLSIPLWFSALLSALLLWLAWHKTRPKSSDKGFPVEVGGGGGKEAKTA